MTPSDLFTQVRTFWQEANTPTRAAIAGGGALLLILAISLTFWAASPDFVRVYTGEPSQAQNLAKELDKAGVAYQISEDGGVLSVRRADAGRARQIAGGIASVATSGQGLRGLDTMGPFTTYEQQRVRIERAQEEAIEQELGQYAGVRKAAVNLALAADNARVGEDVPPKAAVTLTPLPGTSFSEAQVAAMAHVVANSVPSLTPENVTIASAEGVTLWAGPESASGTQGPSALQTRTRAEKEYNRSRQAELQASLDRVFGPGKALVYVDATLDLDKQETEAKRVVPITDDGKGLPVSEATTSEQYSGANGAAGAAGGAAGVDANRPGAPGYVAGGGNGRGAGNYKNTTETINYENTTENVRTTKAVGEPKRINVSLMVDDKLSAAVQKGIDTWLRGSVINPTNETYTTVTTVAAPFDRTAETAAKTAQAASERQAWLAAYAPYIVLPICLALLLLGAWLLTRRKTMPSVAPEMALAGGGGMTVPLPGTRIDELIGDGAGDSEPAALLGESEEDLPLPRTKTPSIEEKPDPDLEMVLDFVDKRPETAALLLRSWTAEETRPRG